jgi:hypothetical protein
MIRRAQLKRVSGDNAAIIGLTAMRFAFSNNANATIQTNWCVTPLAKSGFKCDRFDI